MTKRTLPQLTLALFLSACGGPDTSQRGEMMIEDPDPATTVSFARVFEEVIMPAGCTSGYCHGSGAGYLMLTDRSTSYQSLVGANAFNGSCGVELRVAPMDPDQSLLWRKIAPDVEVCESKMPQGTPGLSAEQAELVHRWIMAGAPE